ncbi:hypothetical protein HPB50_003949 [Hyalomma asiaticum]|uniref:Uncharacterized protein n=1 Tax=Hyalomma asiaticum TaxID=266040 RepID=A0ACB7RIZ3_HYAAI|nr:hypothetical protein HPB50_003949 [Hyalomma asiaticum]
MESPKERRSPSRSLERAASKKAHPSSTPESQKLLHRSPEKGSQKNREKADPRQDPPRTDTDKAETSHRGTPEGNRKDRSVPGRSKTVLRELSAELPSKVPPGTKAGGVSPASTSATPPTTANVPSTSTRPTGQCSSTTAAPLRPPSQTSSAGIGTAAPVIARPESAAKWGMPQTPPSPWPTTPSVRTVRRVTRDPHQPAQRMPLIPGQGTPRETRSYRSAALTALSGIATTVIFCVLAYVFFARSARQSSIIKSPVCTTEDCKLQARILQRWLNMSVDPCHDFDGYVCSKRVYAERGNPTAGVMGYGLKKWADSLEDRLSHAAQRLKYAGHVLAVFRTCLADVSRAESRKAVKQLKEFMRELRVSWPETPPAGVDPLEVVLDLSLNWRFGLWFDASVLRYGDGTYNAVFRPATLYREWFSIEQDVEASAAHHALWSGLYREFALDEPLRSGADVEKIVRTHNDIYGELKNVITAVPTAPLKINLWYIAARTENVSADRWRNALEAASGQRFRLSDSVTFTYGTLLEAVNNIFHRYNDTALLEDISWTFIQVFSAVADRDFLALKYGTSGMARQQRRFFCATELDAAYRWILLSILVAADFPRQSRDAIDASLNEITHAVASLLENASWTNPDLGKALSDKVRDISVTLWPSESLLTEEGLSKFHSGWFSRAGSFTEHWIAAARNWRKLMVIRDNHRELSEQPRNFLVPFLRYDHFLNAVRIALVTLSPPWYYAEGTKAMAYGSLGFTYALQLVRSFDATGIQVDPDGRITESWLPAGSKAALAKKASCLGHDSGKYGDFFPEIVAMEAVQAAYEMAATEYDHSVMVFPTLNEDQLFFVAACITVCGLNNVFPVELRVSCNKAVSAMPSFASAFRCRKDAAMNPARKCAFFA